MSVSRTKCILTSLILSGFAFSAFAQSSTSDGSKRDASFLAEPGGSDDKASPFSGLATGPAETNSNSEPLPAISVPTLKPVAVPPASQTVTVQPASSLPSSVAPQAGSSPSSSAPLLTPPVASTMEAPAFSPGQAVPVKAPLQDAQVPSLSPLPVQSSIQLPTAPKPPTAAPSPPVVAAPNSTAAVSPSLTAPVASTTPALPQTRVQAPAPVAAASPLAPPASETTAPSISTNVLKETVETPKANAESIGLPVSDALGANLWKNTPRALVERELSLVALTASPVLNDLMRRLLTTPAAPPEGASEGIQSMTAMRVEKLVGFADAEDAWSIAFHADTKLVDDITVHFAAEAELANESTDVCLSLPSLMKDRPSVDWQKALVVCQLHDKGKDDDSRRAAQATLLALASDPNHDSMFLEVANKDVLGDGKSLPHQLTPLTPSMLALLKLTNMPLPGELYGHPDFAYAPALLHAPAKQDVAQLGLAERAASRNVISALELESYYRAVAFLPDELSTPLTSSESGSRLRALLYQAASTEKQASNRVAYAVRFLQSAPVSLLNGAGGILGDMLGTLKSDPSLNDSAIAVAQIYMLAGRGDLALDWVRVAKRTSQNSSDFQALWPQLTLAGTESGADFEVDLNQWLDSVLKSADPQADMRVARDMAASTMLLLDAAGFSVPDLAWSKVLSVSHNEKHVALSPILLARLEAAGSGNRRGETILLATALAGDGEISLPASVAITRALRNVGLKNEAGTFARQAIALLTKPNS